MKNLGFADFSRRGRTALNSKIGAAVLIVRCLIRSCCVADVDGPWKARIPELAITTSRWVILCSVVRVAMAFFAESGEEAS